MPVDTNRFGNVYDIERRVERAVHDDFWFEYRLLVRAHALLF